MSYKNKMYGLAKSIISDLAENDKLLASVNESERKLSREEYILQLEEVGAKRNDILRGHRREADRLFEEKKKEIRAAFVPVLGDVTDEATLLNSGVINYSAKELEDMFDRYSGNHTMQRIVRDYADKKNVQIDRELSTDKSKIESAEKLHQYVYCVMSRPEYADIWLDKGYYDEISSGVDDGADTGAANAGVGA